MFDADKPITTTEQDRLNRAVFAKYLARCILDHHDPESMVVGLYGGWGVGKTSIINLVIEEFRFAATNLPEDEQPIVLNFSAWSYSGQHQLIYSFFRRLSSTLRSAPALPNANRIIHLLELYVSYFTQKPVPKPLRTKRSWWEKLTFQHQEEIYAWESGQDLTLIKAELNELLRQQKHKIIIIIDNISRLYSDEIKQIFQIVKSMGDYANTTYLLAFDKEQVVDALNHLEVHGGEEYVEKVIQLPFEVPPILQQDLENIFADRLNDVLPTIPEDAWNMEYWADIYYSSLRYLFKNCRDITRYINTLNFGYSRLRDVVNPVDFFALTAIEVFYPEIYFGIRDNKDLFTDLLDNVYVLNDSQIKKEKIRCDEILARSTPEDKDILLEILIRLFPRLRRIYQPEKIYYYSDAAARRARRVSSPDLFDVYFRLSMQHGQIPEAEFQTILGLASDKAAFDQALTRLNQDERIMLFLDQLDSKVLQNIPRENIDAIVDALFDNGDLFPQGRSDRLSLDTPMRIHRITHALLQRHSKSEDRFLLMQDAIAKASKSIYISVHELIEQSHEHDADSATFLPLEFRDLTPDQLSSLRKLAVSRIEVWAHDERLITHPRLIPILFAWKDWGDEEACRRYVDNIIKTDKGLVAFLTAILEQPITSAMTKYEKNPAWHQYHEDINAFVPPHLLVEHAKILFEDEHFEKLREREQLALMIFLDLENAATNKVIRPTSQE